MWVLVDRYMLRIFYSRVGDTPERILMAKLDMRSDWLKWNPTEPVEVHRPQDVFEGIEYPLVPSVHGTAVGVQQLRDPFVMFERGVMTIFYTGAGESVICGANIFFNINYR